MLEEYQPDRVIIEPSGVGKLSDIVKAIEDVKKDADIEIDGRITVVDGKKAKLYLKNFGEFFKDQVEHASTIVISRTQAMSDDKIEECVHMLREENKERRIISTPWGTGLGFERRSAPMLWKGKQVGRIAGRDMRTRMLRS
ncbi:MAG: GTP-binding protein [[Clostridium] scindens]